MLIQIFTTIQKKTIVEAIAHLFLACVVTTMSCMQLCYREKWHKFFWKKIKHLMLKYNVEIINSLPEVCTGNG